MTCTYVLDKVLNDYNKNNTKVYSLLLEASKAFDRMHYLKLSHTLVDKEMCPLLIRFLINMYISQTMCVAWRKTLSNHFSVSNGVKQGGGEILPILYTIYHDHLLNNFQMAGLWCTIGLTYVGVLSYADDIVLLAPTKTALHKMLHICDQFSIKYHVNFNANKSNLVIYDVDETEDDNNKTNFQNSNVNLKPNAVHHGNIVGETNENDRIDTCLSEFNRRL